jgi:hypothetical protein
MVSSPRKRAPPTTTPAFNQTWDENDAAFFNPESLPVAKIPRGWERKQEVKKIAEGKEKKIWRRFNLRSRADTPEEQDIDVEEQDAQSRPVKRRQHMSPQAMEKTSISKGKKRVFKATRWDRRKSLLPSTTARPCKAVHATNRITGKKSAQTNSTVDAEDSSEHEDSIQDTSGYSLESVVETDMLVDQNLEHVQSIMPEDEDRRSTFTFAMDAPTVEEFPDYESLNGQEGVDRTCEPTSTEDATLTNLFRSPFKRASGSYIGSPEGIHYPQLPNSDTFEPATASDVEQVEETGEASDEVDNETMEDPHVDAVAEEALCKQPEALAESHPKEDSRDAHDSQEPRGFRDEVTYPTLHIEDSEAPTPQSRENSEGEEGDTDVSDVVLDANETDTEEDDSDVPRDSVELFEEAITEEEFTEASLQLDIQQQYAQEFVQNKQDITTAGHEPEAHCVIITQDALGAAIDGTEDHAPESMNEEEIAEQTPASPIAISEASEPEISPQPQPQPQESAAVTNEDITDGLTLSFTPLRPTSADPTLRKLHSPPPPLRMESGPEDATMTIAIDDDTAILKDFLTRAAASKAERAATHRRESIQNRRDSDVIRHALASPRKALEDKDPNSPSKYDNELTLDLSQNLTLTMPDEEQISPPLEQADEAGTAEDKSSCGSRRSSRTKKSRLPAPASIAQAQSSKIAIRRADGNEVVVLKKTDAQELATLTKANTRKNKQGAFCVSVRLLKLAMDSAGLLPVDDATKELVVGKNVRWDEQLAYYQENPETIANLLAEAESLATPDELSMPDVTYATPKAKKKTTDKNSTPKIRRVRGLGTANGTPGKGLLAPSSLLPDLVQNDKEKPVAQPQQPSVQQHQHQQHQQHLPRPKPTKIKKMQVAPTSIDNSVSANPADTTKLPSLDMAPVGVGVSSTSTSTSSSAAGAQRNRNKSRLAAPKKVVLPHSQSQSQAVEGKENATANLNVQRTGTGTGTGLGDATPRKRIPAPKVLLPPPGMESALPRRRGRKY